MRLKENKTNISASKYPKLKLTLRDGISIPPSLSEEMMSEKMH